MIEEPMINRDNIMELKGRYVGSFNFSTSDELWLIYLQEFCANLLKYKNNLGKKVFYVYFWNTENNDFCRKNFWFQNNCSSILK
jgi:hypothetical protein